MKILLVEDDYLLLLGIQEAFARASFNVTAVSTLATAMVEVSHEAHDMLIIDLGLLDGNGETLIQHVRNPTTKTTVAKDVPIMVLTASEDMEVKLGLLENGVDDFLIKPITVRELIARAHALLRRARGSASNCIEIGSLCIDVSQLSVRIGSEAISLSAREMNLLIGLCEKPGAILSKERLEAKLYAPGEEVESNALEVHIHNLRRKLRGTQSIRTIRGMGYRINSEFFAETSGTL